MSVEDTPVEKTKRKICPLFPNYIEGKGYVYADEISRIELYWQPKMAGQANRRRIPEDILVDPATGEPFVIDFYETTDQDVHRVLGGGDYYVEPHNLDGTMMKGGRPLLFGGAPKVPPPNPQAAAYYPGRPRPASELNGAGEPRESEVDVMRGLRDEVLDGFRSRQESPTAFAEMAKVSMSQEKTSLESLRAMQEQLNEVNRQRAADAERYNRQLENDRQSKREDDARLARAAEEDRITRQRAFDDARDEMRAKMRANDLALAEVQAESNRRIDAIQRRADKEADEARNTFREDAARRTADFQVTLAETRKLAEDRARDSDARLAEAQSRRVRDLEEATRGVEERIAQATARFERRARDAEKDLEEMRASFSLERDRQNKEIKKLQEENIELRQEIADGPAAEEEPPPPPAPGGALSGPAMPWPVAILEKYAGPFAEKMLQNAANTPPVGQAQQAAAQQFVPQQIPAQPVYVAQPPVHSNPVVQPQSVTPAYAPPPAADDEDDGPDDADDEDAPDEMDDVPPAAWADEG